MRLQIIALVAALSVAVGDSRAQSEAPQATRPATAVQTLFFPSGDVQLSGRLFLPRGATRFPLVVMVTGSGDGSVLTEPYTETVAAAFTRAGIGVLAYDKRGTGKSGGAYTGTDFEALGRDAAAAVRYARQLHGVTRVGVWGISQAGWVIPYAMRERPGVEFVILVSPAGVNPHEQVTFFLNRFVQAAGFSQADADKTEAMHRATVAYYATGRGYRRAQAVVDRYRGETWFNRLVAHPLWDEMASPGKLYTPDQLARAVAERPRDFELVRSRSSFLDYRRVYSSINVPTLILYGSEDRIVPVERSQAIIEPVLRRSGVPVEVRVFEGADHNMEQPANSVRPDILELMSTWARSRFDAAS